MEGLDIFTATEESEGKPGRGVTGANWRRKSWREPFQVWCSLYADDAGNLFDSREKLQEGIEKIHAHFKRFGLTMHVGRDLENGGADSKTEAMYVPPAGGFRYAYGAEDTSPLEVDGGLVPFTKSFRYLGSLLSYNTSCVKDVNARTAKAAGVFGALRKVVFCANGVSLKAKAKVYMALVVSILLYGSECWALRRAEEGKLSRFHRECVRKMCGVTLDHQLRHRISSKKLEQRLKLGSMRDYISKRVLTWGGHVVRMARDRLPRKLFFGWVNHPRKSGGQELSFGRRFERTVKAALVECGPDLRRVITGSGIDGGRRRENRQGIGWYGLAKDRDLWRQFAKTRGMRAAYSTSTH